MAMGVVIKLFCYTAALSNQLTVKGRLAVCHPSLAQFINADQAAFDGTLFRGNFIVGEHCILVIEDQEDLAELYETTLKKSGYKVRNAYTGEEGLAEFRANGADCVVLDMTLPEMHGAQVLHEIRSINASVPVIIVTGESGNLHRDLCQRLGVQAFLSKPINYEVLLDEVKTAIAEPPEAVEIITLRLPTRILEQLQAIDSNLEQAITQLIEERTRERSKTSTA
jgi:DNA-binding response OmpR family regulator